MNKKVLTLCVSALLAGAWTTLEAKVVEVATPQIGNAYVIGTSVDEVSDEVTSLLNADGTIAAEATEVTATTTKWTLEGISETNFFYLKNSEGKYLSIASEVGSNDWIEYAETTDHAVKFKLDANGKTLRVAETISNTGTFQAECPLVIQNHKIRIDYGQTGAEGTAFAFALYTSEEAPKGMPGLDEVITTNGKVDKETLTANITVPAPLNIFADGKYISVTTNDNGDYIIAEEDDVIIEEGELNADNSLAASWEWRGGYLVSTAALRAAEPEMVYLVYGEDGYATVSTSIYDNQVPTMATNFAEEGDGIADATITVSETSLQADEAISDASSDADDNIVDASNLELVSSLDDYVIVKL